MPNTVIVGAQWGDEGKGKVIDIYSKNSDVVVRYQGGNNAGHTVIHGGRTLKLHLIPSGIMYPHITPVIGNGCVVDPKVLLEEMDRLEADGLVARAGGAGAGAGAQAVRINASLADLDLAFGELPFYQRVRSDMRSGNVG